MVQIVFPSIIHIFTPISFPQLLIIFLVYPYIPMEPLTTLYFLFHMLIFIIYHIFISLISDLYRCYIILEYWHVIHITIFSAIQGIVCVTNCLNFCTIWEGVCNGLFSISDYVFRSEFENINKHLYNSPTSSDG